MASFRVEWLDACSLNDFSMNLATTLCNYSFSQQNCVFCNTNLDNTDKQFFLWIYQRKAPINPLLTYIFKLQIVDAYKIAFVDSLPFQLINDSA